MSGPILWLYLALWSQADLVTMRQPALARLDPLAGQWEGTCTVYSTPTSALSTSPMKATFRWILRTYHLEGSLGCTMDGKPYEARLLIGYDWQAKRYPAHWIDNISSLADAYRGAFADARTLVLTASRTHNSKTLHKRIRLALKSADEWDMSVGSDAGGEMVDGFLLRATRGK